MITTKQRKLLSDLWSSWQHGEPGSHDTAKLFAITYQESKDHDRFRGREIRRGMTIIDEARYFALKRVAEFAIDDQEMPNPANYFHLQQSVYAAYALCNDGSTGEAVRDWASSERVKLAELLTWDYVEMIE